MASQTTIGRVDVGIIADRLGELRRRIRRWIFVAGFSRWTWLVIGLALADLPLDRFFRMDLAQRAILLGIASLLAGSWLVWRVLRPLTFRVSDDALLLQIEARHRALQQQSISAYQLARETDFERRGMSTQLAHATIDSGLKRAAQVDFSSVLNRTHGTRNWLLLLFGWAALAGLAAGIWQTDLLRTWFRRNVLLTHDEWPRDTHLLIVGVQDGILRIPRGSDHRQLVHVTPESAVTQVAVSLEVDAANGRTIHSMKATGREEGREHAFVFHSLGSNFKFRASGGDALTDWVAVELVEPPAIASLQLESILPDYTGLTRLPLEGPGPHSVLTGSQLKVVAISNKPLQHCGLRMGEQSLELTATNAERTEFEVVLGANDERGVAGGKYEFQLSDEGGLENLREFAFTVKTRDDAPPNVRGTLLGISGLVVPRALIPVSYTIQDEYGLTAIDFDCHWTAEIEVAAATDALIPVNRFERSPPVPEHQDVAVLQLEELRLAPGSSLRFVLQARDNQSGDVGLGKSREFLLRVVTEEELLADLLRREIDQRKAFQAAYDAQLELVSQTRQLSAVAAPHQSPEKLQEDRQTDLLGIHRGQRAIGTTIDGIARRFEEFLVEVQNNRLDEETRKVDPQRTIEARFDGAIIQPIRQLDQEWVSAAARGLDNCRRSLAEERQLHQAVEETARIQETILERMRQILAAMEDSENFQEVVNKLLEIKRSEERMKQQLNQQGNPEKIFDDPGKGVFDDDK